MESAKPGGKKIVIIGGPNGAGKTTFADEFLPHEASCPWFINADLIAAGLSPYAPATAAVRAGRIMLAEMDRLARAGANFAFETTFSGHNYVRRVQQWKKQGYRIEIIFLSLPSPSVAVARVKLRVRQGGHDVPEAVIRRRFESGWDLFQRLYRPLADQWAVYDNGGRCPILIAKGPTS